MSRKIGGSAVSEYLKVRYNAGLPSNLYFWRDNVGLEIDLLLEEAEGLRPIEIKSGATVTDDFFKGLRKWLSLAGAHALPPRVVCTAPQSHTRSGIEVRCWQEAGAPPAS